MPVHHLQNPTRGPIARGGIKGLKDGTTETDEIGGPRIKGLDQGTALPRSSLDEALKKLLGGGSGGGC